MRNIILLAALLFTSTLVIGQVPGALGKFLKTDFIKKFDDIKKEAESTVMDFKAVEHEFPDQITSELRDKYDSAAGLFNNVLLSIKSDLKDKGQRKYIRRYPDKYAEDLIQRLEKPQKKYEEFLELYESEVEQGFCIPCAVGLIIQIYDLAQTGFEVFQEIKMKAKDFTEQNLEKYLMEQHHFKVWDSI